MGYEEDRFIIDTMQWSFSRVNSFDSCKYAWRLQYLEHIRPEYEGFFASFGTYIHGILEKYFNNELSFFELSQYYREHFNEEVSPYAPYNKYVDLRDSYFEKGLDYFENFDFDFDKYEILGVEKQVKFEIEGYPFIGYIDLLCKDREDGKLVLIDHKSASITINKNGFVAKKDKHHFLEFQRQQYLYSKAVIEEYGDIVKELKWNMFKDQKWLSCEWNKIDYDEALAWAVDTIHKIEEEKEWPVKEKVDFFCNNICDVRKECPLWIESRREYEECNSEC